jgi:cell division protein FtsQ
LRQIGAGEPIWWRASQSPTPSTTRKPTPAAASRKPLLRLASPKVRARRKRQRALCVATAAVVGATTFLLVAGSGASTPNIQLAMSEVERMLDVAGLGLTQVSLTGHRLTPDSDIFEAIDLASTPTLLSFDSRTTKARLERLSWVERASIERVFPDRLNVHILERKPFAVWRLGTRHFLIDKTGHVLSPVSATTAPELPRFAGEGAAAEAGDLYTLLSRHPRLLSQLVSTERVAERRWRLRLAAGNVIELPTDGVAEALPQALRLLDWAAGEGAKDIDLRVADRALVRPGQGTRRVGGQASIGELANGGI